VYKCLEVSICCKNTTFFSHISKHTVVLCTDTNAIRTQLTVYLTAPLYVLTPIISSEGFSPLSTSYSQMITIFISVYWQTIIKTGYDESVSTLYVSLFH
jgi:hypothetical protein